MQNTFLETSQVQMDDFNFKKSHVPSFGNWDCTVDDLPFTQCFESARQDGGPLRYSYSKDRDMYVAGDLYQNNVVTPTVIVVPRRKGKARYQNGKEEKKEQGWVGCDCDCDVDVKEPPSPVPPSPPPRRRRLPPKAVDEDLYRISPGLLRPKSKTKRVWGFFSSCLLLPSCVLH